MTASAMSPLPPIQMKRRSPFLALGARLCPGMQYSPTARHFSQLLGLLREIVQTNALLTG